MQGLIAFLFVFSIIVIIHEFGHYYFAKKAGILVREFAIGMGPKIFQVRKGETVYTLRLLPIGGYVRMAGHDEDEQEIKCSATAYRNPPADHSFLRFGLPECKKH